MRDISEGDRIAACSLIESRRRHQRSLRARTYHKNLTTRVSKEEGRQVSIHLRVVYDPKNDSVSLAECVRFCNHAIFPGTQQVLTCHNQAGIDNLLKKREYRRLHP